MVYVRLITYGDAHTMQNDDQRPSRSSVLWPLLFLVYLFLVANSLFTGLFAELEDRAAHTYRPDAGADVGAAILTLLFTAGPLVGWLWWQRQNRAAMDQLGSEERLIVRLLGALLAAAVLRNALVLALRLDTAVTALEGAILAVQGVASVVLLGGGLMLLNRNIGTDDSDSDALDHDDSESAPRLP